MRIYVANLAAYNAGMLVGDWIDPSDYYDEEELMEVITEIAGEEYAIHDYDSFPNLGEYPSAEDIVSVAQLIAEGNPWEAVAAYIDYVGDVEYALEHFEDAYAGQWASEEDYATELIHDIYNDVIDGLPHLIQYHIDYEGIARDLFMTDYTFIDGHVFRTDV